MSKKEEKLYMVLDDTVDIGDKPLPIETEKDKAFYDRCKEYLKECRKNKQ